MLDNPMRYDPAPNDPVLVARSRGSLMPAVLSTPLIILLVWVAQDMYRKPHDVMTPWIVAFLAGCAVILAAVAAIALWRKYFPRDELIITETAITSNLFWGAGTIAWRNVTNIKMEGVKWLHIFGTDVHGKKRRLIFDLQGLDHDAERIAEAVLYYLPDLSKRG